MAARPDPGDAMRSERFPLAARALAAATQTVANPQGAQRRSTQVHNWALYLFLFLLPLQNLQTGYMPRFGGGLNFLNVMFVASLIGAWVTGGRLAHNEPVNRWILAYAAYALVSLLVGYGYVSGANAHWSVLKDQLVAIFVCYLVQMSVRDWIGVRRVIIATLLPLPYIAKVTWVKHESVDRWHYTETMRVNGTFSLLGANEFAAFCVTVAVVLFALLIAARLSKSWRLALVAGIACMVTGVLFAYSRTAYVSVILGLLTIALAWRGRWRLVLPLLLAAALAPALLPTSVIERFASTTVEQDARDESTESRFEFWQIAWDNFARHPIVGTGYHSFHHHEINPHSKDTHNLYMRALTEGGVLGATFLLGLLFAILRTARRELARAPAGSLHYGLALGLLGAWVALACGNLFGDRFTYFPMIAYFWAYTALVVKARHLGAERRSD